MFKLTISCGGQGSLWPPGTLGPPKGFVDLRGFSRSAKDPPKILNLILGVQAKIKNTGNEDDLQWKRTSKY